MSGSNEVRKARHKDPEIPFETQGNMLKAAALLSEGFQQRFRVAGALQVGATCAAWHEERVLGLGFAIATEDRGTT